MPSSHLILCCPLLHLSPIPPSIKVFSNESTLHMRWPEYWSISFSIIPSKEIPGLISFRMDWLDLLAVQGTLKSLLQHHSSKASVLWHSAFFTVQLSPRLSPVQIPFRGAEWKGTHREIRKLYSQTRLPTFYFHRCFLLLEVRAITSLFLKRCYKRKMVKVCKFLLEFSMETNLYLPCPVAGIP